MMELLNTIFNYLVNIGTDGVITAFVKNNVILCSLLGAIAYITPWSWDNKLYDHIKRLFTKQGKEEK